MVANKKTERIAKKNILNIFGGLTLMMMLIVSCSADPNSNDDAKQESTDFTPCQCAYVSYKAVKNGGVDNLSSDDAEKMKICNDKMASSSFMAEVKICPSYLKMQAYYDNPYK